MTKIHLVWATVVVLVIAAIAIAAAVISVTNINSSRDGNLAMIKAKQICAQEHGNWDKISNSCYFR